MPTFQLARDELDADAAATATWASTTLAQFDALLHEHGAEVTELRSVGVTQARIDSLYPFTSYLTYGIKLREVLLEKQIAAELKMLLLEGSDRGNLIPNLCTSMPKPFGQISRAVTSAAVVDIVFSRFLKNEESYPLAHVSQALVEQLHNLPLLLAQLSARPVSIEVGGEVLSMIPCGSWPVGVRALLPELRHRAEATLEIFSQHLHPAHPLG